MGLQGAAMPVLEMATWKCESVDIDTLSSSASVT
jgi:hypothetical protein